MDGSCCILSMQAREADRGCFCSLVVGREANNSSPQKTAFYEMLHTFSDTDGVTEEWRKFRNCEFHDLYSSSSIRSLRMIK